MSSSELAVIGEAVRRADAAGYDGARAMPNGFYTDPDVFELERSHLYAKEWVCIGRVEELPKPGSYFTFELCDEPLVAVRGDDDRIRVLSNVCRHRGALIASGSGQGGHLRCPYHQWSYHLDGRLARAPRMAAHTGFDADGCRLPAFATEEWTGFLFVSLDPDPEPLAPRLAPLTEMIRNYHLEEQVIRFVADEVWPTNWKQFVENFMEGYHLTPLHSSTLHTVNPTRLCRHFPPGDDFFGYLAGFSPELARVHGHPDLTESEAAQCVMFAIPPGLVSGCSADYSSFICIQPESVDRVRLKMGLLFYGDQWTDDAVDQAVDLFIRTNAEDKHVLLDMMRGRASKHVEPGPLAPADFEGTLVDFYRYLHRRIGPAIAGIVERALTSGTRGVGE